MPVKVVSAASAHKKVVEVADRSGPKDQRVERQTGAGGVRSPGPSVLPSEMSWSCPAQRRNVPADEEQDHDKARIMPQMRYLGSEPFRLVALTSLPAQGEVPQLIPPWEQQWPHPQLS